MTSNFWIFAFLLLLNWPLAAFYALFLLSKKLFSYNHKLFNIGMNALVFMSACYGLYLLGFVFERENVTGYGCKKTFEEMTYVKSYFFHPGIYFYHLGCEKSGQRIQMETVDNSFKDFLNTNKDSSLLFCSSILENKCELSEKNVNDYFENNHIRAAWLFNGSSFSKTNDVKVSFDLDDNYVYKNFISSDWMPNYRLETVTFPHYSVNDFNILNLGTNSLYFLFLKSMEAPAEKENYTKSIGQNKNIYKIHFCYNTLTKNLYKNLPESEFKNEVTNVCANKKSKLCSEAKRYLMMGYKDQNPVPIKKFNFTISTEPFLKYLCAKQMEIL